MAADPITKNTVSDLLDYDVSDDDDPFKEIEKSLQVRDDKPTLSPRAVKRKADDDKENDILGLDEEVKITKKRKPIAKLDETRLLSQPGIPKLRALARSGQIAKKLHFKGRGHEFSDAGKLLNYYQLWLDNLYPRAKFADGLQLVEKAGHSKMMQTMRKQWIDEGKPGFMRREATVGEGVHQIEGSETADATKTTEPRLIESNGEAAAQHVTGQSISNDDAESEDLFFPDTHRRPSEDDDDDDDDDDAAPAEDELDALLAEHGTSIVSRAKPAEPASEDEDDLEALLVEHESRSHPPYLMVKKDSVPDGDEDDDLDALQPEREASGRIADGFKSREAAEDEDDLDALLAEHESGDVDGADVGTTLPSPLPTTGD